MQNFCIFLNLTVLLPERFTDVLPSAYTFGTLFGILQRAIQIQSCSFWEPLRVLLLRWANCRFPAPFFWHNMQLTNFIIALFFLLSILSDKERKAPEPENSWGIGRKYGAYRYFPPDKSGEFLPPGYWQHGPVPEANH